MSKKDIINVGIICHKLEKDEKQGGAGVGRHIYKILEEVDKRSDLKDKYKFFLYFKKEIPKDIPFLDNPIFVPKVAKSPFGIISFNLYFHIALPLQSRKDKCDVLFFPNFILPILCFSKSIVVIPNDIYYEMNNKKLPLKYRIGYKLFTNNATLRATKIITQTNASKNEIKDKKFLRKRNIGVVPLGVHIMEFKNKKHIKKERMLLYVGQAFPRRHLYETIKAFELVATEFKEFNFVAIGVDKYNPPIIDKTVKEINKKLGKNRIIRKESISDEELFEYYNRATMFFYISSSEGMGMPPMEALAYGTCPVVADTATTREIFQKNAFFVKDPSNIEEIAMAIREGLTNEKKRKEIEQKGKGTIMRYSWGNHLESLLDIIQKIV